MTPDAVIEFIGERMEKGESSSEVCRELYKRAYGETISKDLADSWVCSMAVTDGSERENGMKWNLESCVDVGNKIGIDWRIVPRCEWYAILNMMYSDFYKTAKYAERASDVLFYGNLARDWFADADAGETKTFDYYFSVICSGN